MNEENGGPTSSRAARRRWQDWANVGLGAWLFFSSFAFAGSGAYDLAARIVGPLVALVALRALAAPTSKVVEWACAALGAAAVIAPQVFGYAVNSAAAWNTYAVGVLVVVLAAWALDQARGGLIGRS